MESFQTGLFRSIAAAAGCKVGDFNFDDGVDLEVKHIIEGRHDEVALNIQLKCTTSNLVNRNSALPVQLSRKRFDEMRGSGKAFPFILIAHRLPTNVEDWVTASLDISELRHKSYWLNLTGMPAPQGSGDVTVHVPIANTFDDAVLVDLITAHRAGRLNL